MTRKKEKAKERRRAKKLADEAWETAEEGNLDLALKMIRRAVERAIGNPAIWVDQGMLQKRSGDLEGAVKSFEAALRLAPDHADARAEIESIRPRGRAEFDWVRIEDGLTREGCTTIPSLLDGAECRELIAMYPQADRFARTVVMNKVSFGLGEYRYFARPLPDVVDRLRRILYPELAVIANTWEGLLAKTTRFPDFWEGMADLCAASGQRTPSPLMLKYEAGGFNAPHRDLRGNVYFPIQAAVVLGGQFTGGTFVLVDDAQGQPRRHRVPARPGDAILFCTRDRLVPGGGTWGLKPVRHGVERIESGTRYVLGLPFHDFA